MLAFKVLPGLVALLRSRSSFFIAIILASPPSRSRLVSYGPTAVSLKHLLSVCLRRSMPDTNHHHTWTHHMSMPVVQLRSLFCFPKALLRIKNEKVVLCFHAQHENRILCRLSMPDHHTIISDGYLCQIIGSIISLYIKRIVSYTSCGYHTLLYRMYTFKSILKTRYNQSRLSRLTILGYSACSHAFRIISYGCHAISSRSYSDLILIIRGTPRELVCSISFELDNHTIIVYIILSQALCLGLSDPFINLIGF